MRNYNTLLGQFLHLIPRYDFEKLKNEYQMDKYSKGFSTWEHFVGMLYGQLSGLDSLRGITNNLSAQKNKLYHLGIKEIKRSTLSYANNNRNHRFYEELFYSLLEKTQLKAPKHKSKFKNPLYSIDATTIDLCLSLFDWAKFRKTKGGIKLHVKLNHSGYLPEMVKVTNAEVHEKNLAYTYNFEKGDIVAFDRGYNDYGYFANHCRKRIYFVTRLKKNAKYDILENKDTSKFKYIKSDKIIMLNGFYSKDKCPYKLRIIESIDPETGKEIFILTNQLTWAPKTIADIYKERWQIEIFFKSLKQYLKIKSFLGTSYNAVMCQIWIAMISYLLLSYLKFISNYDWTIQKFTNVFSRILFSRKDLFLWLNEPFEHCKKSASNSLQLELIW